MPPVHQSGGQRNVGASITLSNGVSLQVASSQEAVGSGSRFRVLQSSDEEDENDSDEESGPSIHTLASRVQRVCKSDTGWTGGGVWDSSQILAHFLSAEPHRVKGKRVIELGCGCGLVGLTAGALGAQEVTLTDQVLVMAEYNLATNFVNGQRQHLQGRFRINLLKWGNAEQLLALEPPFDLILGSDIMYHTASLPLLADTLAAVSGIATRVLLATPDWTTHQGIIDDPDGLERKAFQRRLTGHGFSFRVISDVPLLAAVKADVEGLHRAVDVIEMWREIGMEASQLREGRPQSG